jgi:hypothetical protein
MTAQELFDKVSEHLLTQGSQCKLDDRCYYRDNGWRKCAVGCLIPDNLYTPLMETMQLGPILTHIGLDGHYDLCRSLQIIHDKYPPSEWRDRLLDLANGYGLEFKHV